MDTNNLLNDLNHIITLLENDGNIVVANDLQDVFVKIAKKNNVPNDPELYSRCKSEVKKKFKVWPSAYGSAALVRLYKSRGGTYRKSK
jgi:hypothetical protein